MSIAEKLTAIAENEQKVYNAGQQESYDRFWDMLQDNGNRQDYQLTFAYWTDAWYNPKYPIVCGNSSVYTATGLMSKSSITDTKVEITITETRADTIFQDCKELDTVRLIRFENVIRFTNAFRNCIALTDITFDGKIGAEISFANSPLLNAASVQSIIDCLADLTGQTAQKVTFHSDIVAKLTDEQFAAIWAKNWNT